LFKLPSDVSAHLRGGGTLLVPTAQRAQAVRLAYAAAQLAAGARAWASADVVTPSAWARRMCESAAERAPGQWPRLLTATEEWLLWREVAHESAGQDSFLDAGVLGESLQRSSERAAAYGVTLTAAAPDSEAEFLYRAQRLFEARSRAMGVASISALTARLPGTSGTELLQLRGFDALSPQLASLARNAAAAAGIPSQPLATPRAVHPADAASQIEAIACWCRMRLLAQPDARLLVMLPGPAGQRERLAAHISAELDPHALLGTRPDAGALVAIEGGEAFAALALPSQALLTLALLAGAELDVESVCRWLTAPYWRSPAATARSGLALQLRERRLTRLNLREFLGTMQLAVPELRPAARELDAVLRQAAQVLGEGSATPRRWSERFEAALAALGWPGPLPPQSAVHQTRLRWRELLEEFGGLATTVESLGRDAALELLRALALRTAYRPANEDVPVTISPMLADPVALYDGIWVGSLSADVLPQPVTPDPFLPHRAQLEAGMPEASAAGRRSQAHSLFAAWLAGTEDLVLSVPAREGDLELLPSPWLAKLAFDEAPPRSPWLPLRLHREACTEALPDSTGTAFNPRSPLPSGTRALTLQNACAFRAYAELRLGATPPEQPEPGVPMDQRGLLLHAALQLLWEHLRDSQALISLDARSLDALIGECVAQAARTLQSEVRGRRRRPRRVSEGQYDLFTVLSPALRREC
jgi:ATP-dependent helicase/nuclease subunit B